MLSMAPTDIKHAFCYTCPVGFSVSLQVGTPFSVPENKYSWDMVIYSEIEFKRIQEWLSMLLKSHMKN